MRAQWQIAQRVKAGLGMRRSIDTHHDAADR
jgi:hypothetical protein